VVGALVVLVGVVAVLADRGTRFDPAPAQPVINPIKRMMQRESSSRRC
jgi:hypothetical protein